MAQLIISPQARQDLEEIGDYIAEDNADAALAFVEEPELHCVFVAENPGVGRNREQIMPGIRSSTCKDYVIFYLPEPESVTAVRILHGARYMTAIFDKT